MTTKTPLAKPVNARLSSQDQTVAALARLGLRNDEIAELRTISRRLTKIGERGCNGYRDERAEKRDERAEERIRERVFDICADSLICHFQTDPRGCAVYVGPAVELRRLHSSARTETGYPQFRDWLESNYDRSPMVPVL